MAIEVWTLTVDNVSAAGIVTTVHRSERECLDSLRDNYADGDDYVENEDLCQFVADQGVVVYIDRHLV